MACRCFGPARCEQVGGGERRRRARAVALLGPGTGLGVSGLLPTAGGSAVRSPARAAMRRSPPATTSEERRGRGPARQVRPCLGRTRAVRRRHRQPARASCASSTAVPPSPRLERRSSGARGAGGDPIASRRSSCSSRFLGGFAGDLALTLGARGGVYVAGGIVAALGDAIAGSRFRERFEAKGRYRDYLAAICDRARRRFAWPGAARGERRARRGRRLTVARGCNSAPAFGSPSQRRTRRQEGDLHSPAMQERPNRRRPPTRRGGGSGR